MTPSSGLAFETIFRPGLFAGRSGIVTGGFLMARECYTQSMKAAARAGEPGAIVNIIADMWAGMPTMGHSGAARAGMLNFTETAALEWAPLRVDGAMPNAKRVWDQAISRGRTEPFDGFHLAQLPKILRD